jgi:hypothetical protein
MGTGSHRVSCGKVIIGIVVATKPSPQQWPEPRKAACWPTRSCNGKQRMLTHIESSPAMAMGSLTVCLILMFNKRISRQCERGRDRHLHERAASYRDDGLVGIMNLIGALVGSNGHRRGPRRIIQRLKKFVEA